MDQSQHPAWRGAKRGGFGRRGWGDLGARSRHGAVHLGDAVPSRRPGIPHLQDRRRHRPHSHQRDKVKKHDGDRILVCFHNTRSFWSTAYHPGKNALYIPHSDACLDMTENFKNPAGFGPRRQVMRPGADPKKFTSIAKVDLSTGKVDMIHSQPVPGNGSALVTAGDLVFWGDMDRRFRAFDADSGKIVWETILGGIISTSTITYSVNGRQYVAVLTGDAQSGTAGLLGVVKDIKPVRGHNAIYVFALPKKI